MVKWLWLLIERDMEGIGRDLFYGSIPPFLGNLLKFYARVGESLGSAAVRTLSYSCEIFLGHSAQTYKLREIT
jgi:hypothetical protein